MKIKSDKIFAAEDENFGGTQFYIVTADDLLDYSMDKNNCWVRARLENYDLEDVLDLDDLEGSEIIDGVLYYCSTDYNDILINGKYVDPLEVLSKYRLSDIEEYISEETPENAIRLISSSEMNWDNFNQIQFAKDLLDEYDLAKVALDAEEIGLIEL